MCCPLPLPVLPIKKWIFKSKWQWWARKHFGITHRLSGSSYFALPVGQCSVSKVFPKSAQYKHQQWDRCDLKIQLCSTNWLNGFWLLIGQDISIHVVNFKHLIHTKYSWDIWTHSHCFTTFLTYLFFNFNTPYNR